MQDFKLTLPRRVRQAPLGDSRLQAADCAAFDVEVTQRRPLRPPTNFLPERTVTAAQREAARFQRMGGRLASRAGYGEEHAPEYEALSIVTAA